jgi:hypothetical protein
MTSLHGTPVAPNVRVLTLSPRDSIARRARTGKPRS